MNTIEIIKNEILYIVFGKGILLKNIEKFESEISWPDIIKSNNISIDIETNSRIVLNTDIITYIKKVLFSLFDNTCKRVLVRLMKVLAFESSI